MRVLSRFMTSSTKVEQFPAPHFPEVAFLGRSNVGKSSVINSLLGVKIAKTSSTPGRTQSINFFEIRWPGKPQPEMIFADLPGYGYSRVPREISNQWSEFIDPYLADRTSLALCLVLVDPNVPSQPSDQHLLKFLGEAGRPFLIVATKSDRLSSNKMKATIAALGVELADSRVISYSAKTGTGREELWREIRAAVANHQVSAPDLSFG
jgi:GTP-binding protein